ncbi:MAG: 2-hydroxyacyl-CoA dehydratase [Candidatus Hydrothermarchaeota archaeon]
MLGVVDVSYYSEVKELESIRLLYQYNASLWDRWAKHVRKGGKVVGTLACPPTELLNAYDVFTIVYKRREDLNRAIIKGDYELKKWISHFGVGECICRNISGGAGSPILGASPGYNLVVTDFVEKVPEWYYFLKKIGNEWNFEFLEIERGLSRREREEIIYDRLLYLNDLLIQLTGEKVSEDRIVESCEMTNEISLVFQEIDTLIRKSHPLRSFDVYNLKVICTDYVGGEVDAILDLCYRLIEELKTKLKEAERREAKRLLLVGGFRNEFLEPIERNGGIVTAAWPYQRFTSHRTPIKIRSDVFRSLARWISNHSGIGTPREDALDMKDMIKTYEIDGVIYHKQCPFGIKAVYESYKDIRDSIKIPFLTINPEECNVENKIREFLLALHET